MNTIVITTMIFISLISGLGEDKRSIFVRLLEGLSIFCREVFDSPIIAFKAIPQELFDSLEVDLFIKYLLLCVGTNVLLLA